MILPCPYTSPQFLCFAQVYVLFSRKINSNTTITEAYSEPSQTVKMELCAKMVFFFFLKKPLNIFAKILDI